MQLPSTEVARLQVERLAVEDQEFSCGHWNVRKEERRERVGRMEALSGQEDVGPSAQ
jgi:hypothetical protein